MIHYLKIFREIREGKIEEGEVGSRRREVGCRGEGSGRWGGEGIGNGR